ncbi:MAG: hypothetical protein K0Q95_962 [Bacteroidota bacterium]|jgi:uncharacterized protein YndB with AHSA1/START domain|nr:hypothetical protein [Bacteroidota bacterium]
MKMKNQITGRAGIRINSSIDNVWEALTNPELIKKYFFGTTTRTDWKAGSPITFSGEWEGKKYEDKGTILEVQPKEMIKYEYWSSMSGTEDKPENYIPITYEIATENDQTKVMITQENIASEEMKKHSLENWKKVLNNLKELLEQKEVTRI